jgi:DNA topoisomerase-3
VELIVAEKPSVAKDIAVAIGAHWNSGTKCYQSSDYRVVSLRGHLLRLKGLRESDTRFQGAWDLSVLEHLPVIPHFWSLYTPIQRQEELLDQLKTHFTAHNITRIINACDAGREGELLFWEVYTWTGSNKPVMRFWVSEALTKEVVLKGLRTLRDASFYQPRRAAAYARQHADWLVGMNLSIAYTAAAGTTYTVGPVQTPTLALVVQRDETIENWVPTAYAEIEAYFDGFSAKLKPERPAHENRPYSLTQEDAHRFLEALRKAPQQGHVISVDSSTKKVKPPKLFSLTTLQAAANRVHGFTAATTLRIAQKLYEEYKCLSYPRTDAEVVGSDMIPILENVAPKLADQYGITYGSLHVTPRNTNNEQLTDHFALVPLAPLPDQATDSERKVYELVLYRFFQAFGPEGVDQTTIARLEVAGYTFETRARVSKDLGWRAIGQVTQEQD